MDHFPAIPGALKRHDNSGVQDSENDALVGISHKRQKVNGGYAGSPLECCTSGYLKARTVAEASCAVSTDSQPDSLGNGGKKDVEGEAHGGGNSEDGHLEFSWSDCENRQDNENRDHESFEEDGVGVLSWAHAALLEDDTDDVESVRLLCQGELKEEADGDCSSSFVQDADELLRLGGELALVVSGLDCLDELDVAACPCKQADDCEDVKAPADCQSSEASDVDLGYLLGASDDELGIPFSPSSDDLASSGIRPAEGVDFDGSSPGQSSVTVIDAVNGEALTNEFTGDVAQSVALDSDLDRDEGHFSGEFGYGIEVFMCGGIAGSVCDVARSQCFEETAFAREKHYLSGQDNLYQASCLDMDFLELPYAEPAAMTVS